MKAIIIGFSIVATSFTACNSNDNSSKETAAKSNDTAKVNTHEENTTNNAASVDKVVDAYIQLKNSLTTENGNDAASAGKQLSEAMQKVDERSFNTDQKKIYDDVKDDIKEHAEHISANGRNIAHQREHFDLLSKDMADLVKTLGTSGQTLYKDFCPMYNNKKGAYWLSETKEIKNPYLGKAMPACGVMKEEIKQ